MENFDNEIWKDIPNYEGLYQASNLGRIKSLKRKTKNQFCKTDIILKVTLTKKMIQEVIKMSKYTTTL